MTGFEPAISRSQRCGRFYQAKLHHGNFSSLRDVTGPLLSRSRCKHIDTQRWRPLVIAWHARGMFARLAEARRAREQPAEEVGIEPDLLQQCGLANRPGTLPLFFQVQ